MRNYGFYFLLLLFGITTGWAESVPVLAPEAREEIMAREGQDVVVEGLVLRQGTSNSKTVHFLQFTEAGRGGFQGVVFDRDLANFPEGLGFYVGHQIRLAGKVNIHRGQPQIIITSPAQIAFVDERLAALASHGQAGAKRVFMEQASVRMERIFQILHDGLVEAGHIVHSPGRSVSRAPTNQSGRENRPQVPGLTVQNPDYNSYDAIITSDYSGDLSPRVRRAMERGQLVIVSTNHGPWFYQRDREKAAALETDYLQEKAKTGQVVENAANSFWKNAPWGAQPDEDIREQALQTKGLYFGLREVASVRPTDILIADNLLTFSFPEHPGSTYEMDDSWGGDTSAWPEGLAENFAQSQLLPKVLAAVADHEFIERSLQPEQVSVSALAPATPSFPLHFPLNRPQEEGKLIFVGNVVLREQEEAETEGTLPDLFSPPADELFVQADMYGHGGAASTHVVALTGDGRVLAWGNNEHGQCDVPEGLNDVVQVVAGYRYSGALRADGEAVFWGQYNFAPEPLADFKDIVQMVVSQNGPVFLRADGTVWRLYRSGSEKISRADRIVQIAGSSDFLMLDAEHQVHGVDVPGWLGPTAALMKTGPMCNTFGVILRDGTVRMWGPNDAGQAMVPPTLRNVVKLIGTNSATYAIGAEGEVVAWGTNYDGTLTLPEKLGRVIDVIPGSSMVALLVEP